MTDTANAPERIWMTAEDRGASWSWPGAFRAFRCSDLDHSNDDGPNPDYPEYVLSTHCDELVAAAYHDAADALYPANFAPNGKYDVEAGSRYTDAVGIIFTRTPDNARTALTAYGERMKAEGAREAQAKIARLTEALDEKQDGGKSFWMKWTQKRLELNRAMFLRDAKLALAGDVRALRNRVELMEAGPVSIVLSAALQENADE